MKVTVEQQEIKRHRGAKRVRERRKVGTMDQD